MARTAYPTWLKKHLGRVVLPRQGRLSAESQKIESEPEFVRLRRQHSAVESAINGLESGGLDQCPDHGIDGFKRYVGLAVLARNLHRLGAVLRKQEQETARRKRGPYQKPPEAKLAPFLRGCSGEVCLEFDVTGNYSKQCCKPACFEQLTTARNLRMHTDRRAFFKKNRVFVQALCNRINRTGLIIFVSYILALPSIRMERQQLSQRKY